VSALPLPPAHTLNPVSALAVPGMLPVFEHSRGVIYCGDAVSVLRELPEASAHCCVTSPPYWGLRDYGTAAWEGGSAECDHRPDGERRQLPHGDGRLKDCYANERVLIPGAGANYKDECGKCGARRIDKQLGLERNPEEYVSRMVEVFQEVRRVLRNDGTLWLNIGDSYATGAGKVGECPGGGEQGERWKGNRGAHTSRNSGGMHGRWMGPRVQPNRMRLPGLKPKDLVGIPWMLAFALRADGWYLRSEIIWAKPNSMPESVTDRPTKAHEQIFLLAKSERYYYDAEAIAEPTHGAHGRNAFRAVTETRNKRTVWTVTTEPFPEAHFATFPQALIRPCILAGCPEGGTVLDPFSGAGTTALVAKENGRRFLGIELNPEYCRMTAKRLSQEVQPYAGLRNAK